MGERFLRSLWRLAKVAAAVAAVVAGLVWVSKRQAREAPVVDPPTWPPLPADDAVTTAPVAAEVGGLPLTVEEGIAGVQELDLTVEEVVVEPEVAPELDPSGAEEAGGAPVVWVLPKDGACPEGYPIKVKEGSGIYHQPGGTSYARTAPDRCYASAADAEADGFRPAKR